MNETINANIGQQAFTLDRNAYDRLTNYLDDVRSRLTTEIRIAELFREWLPSAMMVVTLSMVERAIVRIGRPEEFGTTKQQTNHTSSKTTTKQLRRSRTNRSIAGICGGLAAYIGIDATLLRIVTFLLIFLGGMSLWVYIILWLIIPEED